MRSCLSLPNNPNTRPLPDGTLDPDVRFPEGLVDLFLTEYTQPGDVVFDPFTGFGTTLRVAERMGRVPYGIEYDQGRCQYVRSQLRSPEHLVHGDARRLADYAFPPIAFSLTSPPYMSRHDRENPLTNYTTEGQGYDRYLEELARIYAQIGRQMLPGARAVIEVANLKSDKGATLLAWDLARAVSDVLPFEREIVIDWQPTYGYGYDHSYCLVFERAA